MFGFPVVALDVRISVRGKRRAKPTKEPVDPTGKQELARRFLANVNGEQWLTPTWLLLGVFRLTNSYRVCIVLGSIG